MKEKKTIIISFSLSNNYFERMKKLANLIDISLSGLLRRAFDDFEYKCNKKIKTLESAVKNLNKILKT